MGNDGGDIPGRKELVRQKKVPLPISPALLIAKSLSKCSLSKKPLEMPLAFDRQGNIYNYFLLLEALSSKRIKQSNLKRLEDVKQINQKSIKLEPVQNQYFIKCNYSGALHNGSHLFWANWRCGCVFSDKALLTFKGSKSNCFICKKAFEPDHLIQLSIKNQSRQELKREAQPLLQPPTRKGLVVQKEERSDTLQIRKSKCFKELFHNEEKREQVGFFRKSKLGIR